MDGGTAFIFFINKGDAEATKRTWLWSAEATVDVASLGETTHAVQHFDELCRMAERVFLRPREQVKMDDRTGR